MTLNEVSDIVDKIKVHRPNFCYGYSREKADKLKLEWYRVLEDYECHDVDKKLDEYLKSENNQGRYPDAFYLIKYLKTQTEKAMTSKNYVRCSSCGKVVDLKQYEKHHDRCLSIEYLCKMSRNYFQKNLDKEKLFKLSDAEFEEKYWKFCEKLYDVMEEGLSKYCLKNAILTHYGEEPQYVIKEVSEGIKNEIE